LYQGAESTKSQIDALFIMFNEREDKNNMSGRNDLSFGSIYGTLDT